MHHVSQCCLVRQLFSSRTKQHAGHNALEQPSRSLLLDNLHCACWLHYSMRQVPHHGEHLPQPEAFLSLVGAGLHLDARHLHRVVPASKDACRGAQSETYKLGRQPRLSRTAHHASANLLGLGQLRVPAAVKGELESITDCLCKALSAGPVGHLAQRNGTAALVKPL